MHTQGSACHQEGHANWVLQEGREIRKHYLNSEPWPSCHFSRRKGWNHLLKQETLKQPHKEISIRVDQPMAREVTGRFACLLCAGLRRCLPSNMHTALTLIPFKTESFLAKFLSRAKVFLSIDSWSSHSTYFYRQGVCLLAQADLSLRAKLEKTLLPRLSMEYSSALGHWPSSVLPACSAGALWTQWNLSHKASVPNNASAHLFCLGILSKETGQVVLHTDPSRAENVSGNKLKKTLTFQRNSFGSYQKKKKIKNQNKTTKKHLLSHQLKVHQSPRAFDQNSFPFCLSSPIDVMELIL